MTGPQEEGKGIFNTLVLVSGLSVGAAAFLIGIFVAYDVLSRTFFLTTNSWVTEVTMYLMGYITFVGAAFALHAGAHVRVDLLVQRVQPGTRRVLDLIAELLMLMVVGLLTWLSFQFFIEAWDTNEVSDTLLSLRLWIPYLSFFVGMAWLLQVLIVQVFKRHRRLTADKDMHD